MQTDVFSFVVTRSPIPFKQEEEINKPVSVVSDKSLLDSFRENGLFDENKETVYNKAKSLFESDVINEWFRVSGKPLIRFIDWYDSQILPIADEKFSAAKNDLLNAADLKIWVTTPNFKKQREFIVRNLLIVCMAGTGEEKLKPLLFRAFRFLSAFETLASIQSQELVKNFEHLLNRPLLLPNELFPVNFESAELLKQRRQLEDKNKKLEDDKQLVVKEKTGKLRQYQEAVKELVYAFDKHINSIHEKDIAEENSNGAVTNNRSSIPLVKNNFFFNSLPKESIMSFSAATKDILKKESFTFDADLNIPAVTAKLESISFDLIRSISNNESLSFSGITIGSLSLPVPGQCKVSTQPVIETVPVDFPPKAGKGFYNNIYIGELQMVRQTLKRYELGEIAHIENVMIGESKTSKYRQLKKTEEAITTETETVQESEKEMQTNEQFELQAEVSKTISEEKSKEAGITITGSYGPSLTATATGNIAVHNASEESRNTSTSYAREIINKSVQKIKERNYKQQIRKVTEEIEKTQEHGFHNTGSEHINGVYKWVNKIYDVQVVNYGLRQFLEFIIPEPAAFYRYAQQNKPVEGMTIDKPEKPGYCFEGVFTPLKPVDLSESTYLYWAGKFNIGDIDSPPPRYKNVTFNKVYSVEDAEGKPKVIMNEDASVNIPKNYLFKSGIYHYEWGRASVKSTGPNDEVYFSILLANKIIAKNYFTEQANEASHTINAAPHSFGNGPVTAFQLGYLSNEDNQNSSVTISVSGYGTLAFTLNVGFAFLFERTHRSYEDWQLNTYNKIMTAYNDLESQYNRELENRMFNVFSSIQGRNPFINREVEKIELKKLALSQLTGQNYDWVHLMMEEDIVTRYPQQHYQNASAGGKYIQFFENGFEWQNMTYVFYDYFWANKDNWPGILGIKDNDPLFEKFLHAGAARVQVPLRPGFEPYVLNYLQLQPGEPWDTIKDAVLIEGHDMTPPYLSMLEEIKAQMNVDFHLAIGSITVQNGSKLVVGNGTAFSDNDLHREIIINTRSYRIASVDSTAQQVTLRTVFNKQSEDEAMENIQYYIGVKFVGEPWEILIPTELIYLNNDEIVGL